ncbi:separin protein [Coemansia sp. RSA 1286]|nr:separin protein [Coemansia sp. RSA 1286]
MLSTTTTVAGISALLEATLDSNSRNTLAGWNALALCADTIRKTAKRILPKLRQSAINREIQDCTSSLLVSLLDAADRIYHAYVVRGAAAKAESTGGSKVSTLTNCNAEVCLNAIQLAIQYQEHSAQAHTIAMRLSDRLLTLCRESLCNRDFLRSHSTVFFNRGASLFQLKIYSQAAQAMQQAIDSLSLWITLANSDGQVTDTDTDTLGQLCKRFEIAASAYQANHSFDKASQQYAGAVLFVCTRFSQSLQDEIIVSKDIAIPPFSSTWNRGSVVDRALMFVDRYARMCANRILKDPEESSACVSLLQHFLDDSISGQVAGAWLLEAEAHFWRPFMAPSGSLSASSVLKTRLKHLESAVAIYEQQGCLLGHARCLLEMAKINRDLHAPNDCAAASDNLETALNICKAMPSASSNIYVLSVLVECYAWSSIIKIESGSPSGADISACTILSALVFNQIDGREKDLGVLRNMVDALTLLLGLLMSRRMYSYSHDIQLVIFNIAMLCESSDSAWLPVGMESLVGLGMACMLQGKMQAAEGYFAYAASRYKSSVLPVHVQVASKIAYASFKLASGDMAAGVSVMEEAAKIARDALHLRVSMSLSARKKRQPVSPETLVLLSKASQAYSEIALKQGALADSIDFSVHSYRILSALLKSLSMAHKRNLQDRLPSGASSEDGDRMDVATDDDPFADNGTKGSSLASQAESTESSSANNSSAAAAGRSEQTSDGASDEDKSDAQFVAFSGNWELQRLLIENLAHLAKVYSIRGSVKEAEYFLKKGIEISMQLQAPHQEDFMRLLEADILSRKSLWDECAQALHSLRRRLPESEDASVATGKMEVVCALVNEGDSWRRSRQVDRARSSYSRALEMLGNMSIDEYDGYEEGPGDLAASVGDISQATPRLQRVLAQAGVSDKQAAVSSDCSTRMDGGGGNVAENLPLALSIMKDDIVARLRLLSLLHDTSDSSSSDSLDMVQAGGVMTAGRSVDKQPEHYLMRANLVFIELQRMLSEEPVWKSILQSALLFPAFQKARSQKPRKGTIKALIRDKLAELDGLLRAAAESAITVGSAHCVHESTHLLALVMSMSVTFGFAPIVGSCGRGIEAVIARVVDDSLNITAVRESVDARRRRGEAVPSELTVWPQDILCSKGPANGASDGYRGSRSRGWDDRDSMNTSPVPSLRLGGVKSLDAPPDWSPGALSLPKFGKVSPSKHASFSAVKAADNAADLAEEPFFEIAADGARVVSEWAIDSDASAGHPLSSTLPPSWVVCGISVDDSRNVLFVTRYERGCSPITLCLPMREVELSLEFAEQISVEGQCATSDDGNSSAFASAYQKISAIIAESDRTMKTGSSCSTDEEKRSWWEYRASLDRQLGLFLRGIENVWLGGFRHVLQPGSVLPGAGLSSGLHGKADRSLMVSSLRSEIQSCLSSCLPKAFASKAKTIELSEQLCMLVLGAAHRFLVADPQSSDERASCTGNDDKRSDWLDICSMLWDMYCYQGAAPSSEEAVLDSFAEKLLEVMQQFIGANVWVTSDDSNDASGSERPHLILALDKHAQQIPWECLPALRDYPISRVPSIAFLQQRMATMHARRSAHIPSGSSRSGSFGEDAGDLLSILKGANGGPSDSVTTPDTATGLAGLSVSGQHVFYVLNPEGDLHRTQTNFADYLEAQPGWRGVIGRRPMNLECERGLSSSDIFMYFGHGGAENYISRSQIRSLDKCAVALLFGCSSGRLKMTGEYDAMGTATDYMVGGCPALVGNLWDVGDKDIDRFAASMLQSWGLDRFSPGKIAVKVDGFSTFLDSKPQVKTCVSLAEAVCEARKACRMAYLTGAAPVVYGIPVYLLD